MNFRFYGSQAEVSLQATSTTTEIEQFNELNTIVFLEAQKIAEALQGTLVGPSTLSSIRGKQFAEKSG